MQTEKMKISTYFNTQRTKSDGAIPISICVSRPPQRFYIATGLTTYTIFDSDIFPRSERNHRAKTLRLNQMIDEIEELTISNSLLPIEDLKRLIRKRVLGERDEQKTLYYYVCEFAKTKKGSTNEKYVDTAKKILEFDKNAPLDITYGWLEHFETYLLNTLRVNSVAIHLRNVRAVVNWAIKNDWTTNYPFKKFSIKHERTRKRNLPIDTIAWYRNTPLKPHHAKYRDLFMLSFYLIGINMIDLLTAKPNQLINGRFYYIRHKTHKEYSIKIEREAMEIIERYKGKDFLLRFCDTAKHKSVRCKMNKYIDEILPNVTSYYARHSWATIAYSLGVPKDTISQALGHSMGCETTEIYIERDTKCVDDANRKVIDAIKTATVV